MKYTIITVPDGERVVREDSATIPEDPANSDWVEYQEWLAAGNEPDRE